MSDEWHYQFGDVAKGPISARELAELYRTGDVGEHTYVYHEELGEWTEAKQALDKIVAAGAQSLDPVIAAMDGGKVTWYFLKDGINYGPCQGGRSQIIALVKQGTFTRDTLMYVVGSGNWEQLSDTTWRSIRDEIDGSPIEPALPTSLKDRVENYARENRVFFDTMCAMSPVWLVFIVNRIAGVGSLSSLPTPLLYISAGIIYVAAFHVAPYKERYRNGFRATYMYAIFIGMIVGLPLIRKMF